MAPLPPSEWLTPAERGGGGVETAKPPPRSGRAKVPGVNPKRRSRFGNASPKYSEHRRERNRVSAAASRKRKVAQNEMVEAENVKLREENEELRRQLEELGEVPVVARRKTQWDETHINTEKRAERLRAPAARRTVVVHTRIKPEAEVVRRPNQAHMAPMLQAGVLQSPPMVAAQSRRALLTAREEAEHAGRRTVGAPHWSPPHLAAQDRTHRGRGDNKPPSPIRGDGLTIEPPTSSSGMLNLGIA